MRVQCLSISMVLLDSLPPLTTTGKLDSSRRRIKRTGALGLDREQCLMT